MRLIIATGLLCILSSAAFAMDAQNWQSQLQSEMSRIEQNSPMTKAQGQVKVVQSGANYVATLPALVITAADQSKWTVPSVSMIAPANAGASAKVTIQLPKAISYKQANGQEGRNIAIGEQNIAGTWNFAKNAFENLNGTLTNISFNDKVTATQSTVDLITLTAANAAKADIAATNIQSDTVNDGKNFHGAIAKTAVTYQFTGTPHLTITRIIGLLNPVWLLAENQPFAMTTKASQLTYSDAAGQTSTLASLESHLQIQPAENGKMIGAKTEFDLSGAAQTPESAYSFILPKSLHMSATLSHLPMQALSFGPGQAFNTAKDAAVKAATRADISDLTWDTYNQANLKGKGWLQAAAGVPLGMTGHLTFDLKNLQALMTSLQQQMAKPDTNTKVKTQGFMVLMVLQGLGKQNSQVTQFVIDLTADGQVLVNGNNVAGLIPGQAASPAAGLGAALQGFMSQPAKPAVTAPGL